MEDGDISDAKVQTTLNDAASVTAGEADDIVTNSPSGNMANYPDVEVTVINKNSNSKTNNTSGGDSVECKTSKDDNTESSIKVNGETDKVVNSDELEDEYTSDEDALIIDEECKKDDVTKSTTISVTATTTSNSNIINRKRVRSPSPRANFKGFKKRIIAKSLHFLKVVNDLRSASFYIDLKDGKENNAQIQQQQQDQKICLNQTKSASDTSTDVRHTKHTSSSSTISSTTVINKTSTTSVNKKTVNKKRPSQKLTEYAQYLGLQPAVKFKCVKCSESSFQSLSALNEHQRHCLSSLKNSSATSSKTAGLSTSNSTGNPAATSTNFRVTRKVFLCSSCGTYYENCNLFLHMREVHRRYICLYCLGMFSLPEKLSHHLVTKHNCSPNHYASAEDFLNSYTESCFLVCCHCERVFSERDNFFDHVCVEKRTGGEITCGSCGVKSSSAHLATCKAGIEVPSTSSSTVGHKSTGGKSSTSVQQQKGTSKQNKVSKVATSSSSTKNTSSTAPVEHITADSPSTSGLLSPQSTESVPETDKHLKQSQIEPEVDQIPEMDAAEHFMAAASASPANDIKEEINETSSETTNKQVEAAENLEPVCNEPTSTESDASVEQKTPVERETELEVDESTEKDSVQDAADTSEENIKQEQQEKENSPEPETAAITPTQNENADSEDETKSQTKSDTENVDERKSESDNKEEEQPMLSESTDESMLSEHNNSDAEDNHFDMQTAPADVSEEMSATTKMADGIETNASPSSPMDNGHISHTSTDLNQSDELEHKDESEDNKESDHQDEDEEEEESMKEAEEEIVQETRKVPKVTLKLPPKSMVYSENESDDSEKLTMEVEENCDSDDGSKSADDSQDKPVNGFEENDHEHSDANHQSDEEYIPVAGEDIPIVELELEQPLDKFTLESLLRRCLGATIPTCVYCNHARKIAVNGKQLGLHAIAEHRFAATVNSITAEELIPASFVTRIKECLPEVESVYFSLDIKETELKEDDPPAAISFKRVYECFQCRYVTMIHKELYLHNRKMHAKTILLCIMCKSNFYSYSELICHLCPGNYVLHSETMFRCCMCRANDLPSAFRLMVHLRKRHHTCDVCLEGCHNQSKLSNHVWKHKLHHLCYRCGIAYRNKPDITKHLFWKHGTESVLCKKCLQKKWPHVYHFCIPPVSFVCEECNVSFSKAVYLKVHKRLHSNEKPHACTETNCSQTFISKKLLLKHEARHRNPVPIEDPVDDVKVKEEKDKEQDPEESVTKPAMADDSKTEDGEKAQESADKEEPKKSLIDVYDLPALNLSESDSDDSEEEKPKLAEVKQEEGKEEDEDKKDDEKKEKIANSDPVPSVETPMDEDQKPVPILDGIWDNFKNYQATIEKRDSITADPTQKETTEDGGEQCHEMKVEPTSVKTEDEYIVADLEVIMADHDYCLPPETTNISIVEPGQETLEKSKIDTESGMDHDYCTVGKNEDNSKNNQAKSAQPGEQSKRLTLDNAEKKKSKSAKKKSTKQHAGSSSSSDSSSDSDSSSCTCGSNCSCSSSSGSSSSSSSSSDSDSSSSEGKKRIQARRDRRKERAKRKKDNETSHAASNTAAVDVVAIEEPPAPPLLPVIELPIEESDLDTDETETDEDFYDEHPQRLANKIMAEKRNQLALLAAVAPVNNGNVAVEYSRPSTPSLPEEQPPTPVPTPPIVTTLRKKVKTKKRKKKSRNSTPRHDMQAHNIPEYPQHNHHHHHVRSPVHAVHPVLPPTPLLQTVVVQPPPHVVHPLATVRVPVAETTPKHLQNQGSGSETDSNVRSSKRRRVPNKFYGYSSDEDANDKSTHGPTIKWRKSEITASVTTHHVTGSPQFVPPITIKTIPSPAPVIEPVRAPVIHHSEVPDSDSEDEVPQNRKSTSDSSESNRNEDSDSDTGQLHISQQPPIIVPPKLPPPSGYSAAAIAHHQAAAGAAAAGERSNENLYCYCQCPYDEVSEMIACDGKDCVIEWFHFECVGIMVPPKGKWFCPDCRRKTSGAGGSAITGRSDFIQT